MQLTHIYKYIYIMVLCVSHSFSTSLFNWKLANSIFVIEKVESIRNKMKLCKNRWWWTILKFIISISWFGFAHTHTFPAKIKWWNSVFELKADTANQKLTLFYRFQSHFNTKIMSFIVNHELKPNSSIHFEYVWRWIGFFRPYNVSHDFGRLSCNAIYHPYSSIIITIPSFSISLCKYRQFDFLFSRFFVICFH